MKKTLYILAILAVSIFTACSDDDKKSIEYTMTVASAQRVMFIADHFSPYYVKHQGQNEWKEHAYIKDFSHQEGYEYVIRVRRDYDKSMEGMDGGSVYSYHFLEEISKTPKDSENIPIQTGWIDIASKGTGDTNYPFYMRDLYTGNWKKIAPIEGFEYKEGSKDGYEEGYEYKLEISCKYNGAEAPHKYSFKYIKTHSKEKFDSVGLPE